MVGDMEEIWPGGRRTLVPGTVLGAFPVHRDLPEGLLSLCAVGFEPFLARTE